MDVWLTTPTLPATRWWLGEDSWSRLLQHPDVQVAGDRTLQRQMHHWFKRYVFTSAALGLTPPDD